MTDETVKAGEFMKVQLEKGWKVEEVFSQISGSYGVQIRDVLILSLKRVL